MNLAAVRRQTVFIKIKENNNLVKRKDGKSRNWNKRTNIEKKLKKKNDNGGGNKIVVLRVKKSTMSSNQMEQAWEAQFTSGKSSLELLRRNSNLGPI